MKDDKYILGKFANAALSRRAENVVILDLRKVSNTLDYFLICTASAGLQLNAVHQNIVNVAKELELPSPIVEGPSDKWLLLNFGPIIVHIMTAETREYYDIEGLWSDAEIVEYQRTQDSEFVD